jgi:hypothetical protein
VLACLRIELHHLELFRRRLLVLVGRVEVTGAGVDSSLIFSRPPLPCRLLLSGLRVAAGAQVGDDLLDAHLVDQPQAGARDAQADPAVLASTQKRRYWRFGRKRRLVLLLAWDTLFPTIGRLPVT